jgi:hypothetical protein
MGVKRGNGISREVWSLYREGVKGRDIGFNTCPWRDLAFCFLKVETFETLNKKFLKEINTFSF